MEMGTLTGKVTNKRGEPVADAAAVITGRSPSHKDIAALTNANGEFTYGNLLPGVYTILINAEGYAPKSEQCRVDSGQVKRVTFTLVE